MMNLKAFSIEGSMNYAGNPEQVGQNALLQPQLLQGMAPGLQTNVVQPHVLYNRKSQTNFEVDDQVLLTSVETGFPNADTGMYFTAGSNNVFCAHDNTHGIKRKAEEDYSPFYCKAKRQMMDDCMAAEMNSLYITNEHSSYGNTETFNPDNDVNMQFGDAPSDNIMQDNGIDDKERKEFPVFQFSAPLEEMFKKNNDILPREIYKELCKPCLALVPWLPPFKGESQIPADKKQHKNPPNAGQSSSTSEEMEDEL